MKTFKRSHKDENGNPNKATCVVTISGKTTDIKEELKKRGFRWHSLRRNWFKFGEMSQEAEFRKEAMAIWAANPGKILFSIFDNEHLVEHGKRISEAVKKGDLTWDDIPF